MSGADYNSPTICFHCVKTREILHLLFSFLNSPELERKEADRRVEVMSAGAHRQTELIDCLWAQRGKILAHYLKSALALNAGG